MALIKAQCTNCGGALDVDENKDAAVCPFCNTPFIVEKAINLYKTENHNHVVNNITYNGEGIIPEQKLKNAYIILKQGDRVTARKLLDEYKLIYPTDWRLWYCYYFISDFNDTISLQKAVNNVPDDMREMLTEQYDLPNRISKAENYKTECDNKYRNYLATHPKPKEASGGIIFFVFISFLAIGLGLKGFLDQSINLGAALILIFFAVFGLAMSAFLIKRSATNYYQKDKIRTEEINLLISNINVSISNYNELVGRLQENGKAIFDKVFHDFAI